MMTVAVGRTACVATAGDSGMGARVVARCDALGSGPYSDLPDALFRAWLTPGFARTQEQVAAWMVAAGMDVRLDAATNLVGRYDGLDAHAPVLLIGSHIDSVRDAGRYDGPLGVMLGIECVAALNAAGRRMRFAIEVIAFGDEEGSRFPAAMLTSRAVAGTLDPAMLDVVDGDGVTLASALEQHGHASARWHLPDRRTPPGTTPALAGVTEMANAARGPGSVLAYLEAHIKQGPALEADGVALGVVTGIAAQLRYAVAIDGSAGHAGTTAMRLRRDALAAAAECVLGVERIAQQAAGEVVATVGRLDVAPGVANVIAGHVAFTLDVRAPDGATRDRAAEAILADIAAIAARRGVEATIDRVHDLPASPCDPALVYRLARAVTDTVPGQPVRRLASGAGHDAMILAALCPTAMLFVRCAGGISHNPAESVDPGDVELAARAMLRFIERMEDDA